MLKIILQLITFSSAIYFHEPLHITTIITILILIELVFWEKK